MSGLKYAELLLPDAHPSALGMRSSEKAPGLAGVGQPGTLSSTPDLCPGKANLLNSVPEVRIPAKPS